MFRSISITLTKIVPMSKDFIQKYNSRNRNIFHRCSCLLIPEQSEFYSIKHPKQRLKPSILKYLTFPTSTMTLPYPTYRNLCVLVLNNLNTQKGDLHRARRHALRVEWTSLTSHSSHTNSHLSQQTNVVELVVTSVDEECDTWFQINRGLIMELDGLYREGEGAIREVDGCIFRFWVHEGREVPPGRGRSGA
jgi:hypothetical protein